MDKQRHMLNHPSVLSGEYSSRSFFQSDNKTPETPNPKSAVDMIKNPKWYQRVTENTRVSDSSNSRVEKEIKKIAQLYLECFISSSCKFKYQLAMTGFQLLTRRRKPKIEILF
jgi:hypothetical protein